MCIYSCDGDSTYFSGSSCAEDTDGCGDNPCTLGTNCTDLSPSEHERQGKAYECSECPAGYVDDDGTCVGSYDRILYSMHRNVV